MPRTRVAWDAMLGIRTTLRIGAIVFGASAILLVVAPGSSSTYSSSTVHRNR